MRMVLLGPPAAGKGTQGRWLAARFGGAHVDTGELLRTHVERGTELGRSARGHMERGELLPDEVVIAMVTGRLAEAECVEDFVLDGFPRTVPQAEALDRHLAGRGTLLQAVVELRISNDELHRRMAERAGHPAPGGLLPAPRAARAGRRDRLGRPGERADRGRARGADPRAGLLAGRRSRTLKLKWRVKA